jgi:hypothetical protein
MLQFFTQMAGFGFGGYAMVLHGGELAAVPERIIDRLKKEPIPMQFTAATSALSRQAQAREEEVRQRKPQADLCSGLGEELTRMITHRVIETKPMLSSSGGYR